MKQKLPHATASKTYDQRSIRARLEAFFLDNIGKVATREQIMEVAKDPITGKEPENWHQRLSELRTDLGYTIQSWRNRGDLKVMEYLMPYATKRPKARKRIAISKDAWNLVLERAANSCEWQDVGIRCGLCEGEIDPVGGGTVRLTPDHKSPHAIKPDIDPNDPDAWQALCGRHQVVKKNYWDHTTGKLNVVAIVQSAPENVKLEVYAFLRQYFEE